MTLTQGRSRKIVSLIQKNFENNQKVLTLKKLSEKNKLNLNYESLNINNESLWSVIWATFGIIKIIYKMKDRSNLVLHSHLSKSLYASFLPSIFVLVLIIFTPNTIRITKDVQNFTYIQLNI